MGFPIEPAFRLALRQTERRCEEVVILNDHLLAVISCGREAPLCLAPFVYFAGTSLAFGHAISFVRGLTGGQVVLRTNSGA